MASFLQWVGWIPIGDVANVAQLTGLNAVKLIALIIAAANNARMHKRNCRQFAQHLKLISNLLEQLNLTDLKERPETREPLEQLEEALRKAVVLVESCRDKSYLYLVAMGWVYVSKFSEYQDNIDRYLKLIPLITLVENSRERLKAIEKDRRSYTMEEEEVKVQETLLKPERTRSESVRLSRQLSRRYPGVALDQVLRAENAKLRKELDHMKACMELDQCDVIEHLIQFTETVAADPVVILEAVDEDPSEPPEMIKKVVRESKRHVSQPKASLEGKQNYRSSREKLTFDGVSRKDNHKYPSQQQKVASMPSHIPRRFDNERWHNGLQDCCGDPCLCMSTFLYPCGTFTNIAAVVTDGNTSHEVACHELAFHSLYLGCYCYTCCFRRKLRKRFNIPGGSCDDYWAHALCCCCSLVQEWREIQAREEEELKRYSKMDPPSEQAMEGH